MAVPNIVFDRDGNLWIAHAGDVGVSMLPEAKQSIDTDELKASDWYQFGYSEIKNNKYAKLYTESFYGKMELRFIGLARFYIRFLTIKCVRIYDSR